MLAHTLSLHLPRSRGPPRLPSLCAPAVPLLWLEFVLLCFRMATIEAAPTATHPALFLSPLCRSSPRPAPLSAHALKESERDGFCVQCRCPGWVKGGAEAVAAYRPGGGGYSAWDPPPVAGLDPHESASHSWAIEPLWLNAITLCVARYTQGTWQRYSAACSS